MDQRRGALRKAFQAIEAMLRMGAYHDAIEALNLLHRWSDIGLHLVLPWRIVLAGPPNVGKSSLLNRMLGYTRAIVHAEAGTTRDLLQESTSIDGWLVQLIDSAGVRSTSDTVEKQGVERTMNAIESADRVLLLVDPHQGWTPTHEQVWCERESRCILVRTKSDLADTIQSTIAFPSCCVSATTGDGMDQLMATIADSLVPFDVSRGQAIPFRETHVRWIEERLSFATQSTGA
jgi:tRNA modification GTPase